jgi:hypothetical protein
MRTFVKRCLDSGAREAREEARARRMREKREREVQFWV